MATAYTLLNMRKRRKVWDERTLHDTAEHKSKEQLAGGIDNKIARQKWIRG